MTNHQIAELALDVLKHQDFYYMMVDYGYMEARAKAKDNMRYFVEVTNQLPSEAREIFRNLWIATYEYCRCFSPLGTSPDADEKKANMEAAQLICDQMIANIAA